MNTCMTSLICLPLFSNQHSFQLTQDNKGLFKACNGVECKEATSSIVSSPVVAEGTSAQTGTFALRSSGVSNVPNSEVKSVDFR
ncbi:hypothetical protein H5410_061987 [Solanum commersonii]|uniref:Uncharacterized protein n=1 Tax=Solanum commersonii TaxID=4109 RepID=A0A9J5W9G4_SOLCO|nr:hypothetical protein H5410_061987 [Solanum commersonii]